MVRHRDDPSVHHQPTRPLSPSPSLHSDDHDDYYDGDYSNDDDSNSNDKNTTATAAGQEIHTIRQARGPFQRYTDDDHDDDYTHTPAPLRSQHHSVCIGRVGRCPSLCVSRYHHHHTVSVAQWLAHSLTR